MSKPERTKRRILTAGAGMVAFTAVEGLACGNPVSPRYDMPHEEDPVATVVPVDSAVPLDSAAPLDSAVPQEGAAPEAAPTVAPDAGAPDANGP